MLLSKVRWYTKLDVLIAYNLLVVAFGEEWKTAFHTREELFDFLIMSFRLTNTPASFQTFINHTIAVFLDKYVTGYLDILDEHRVHVRTVLEVLTGAGIHVNIEKGRFHKEEVRNLGLKIWGGGVKMNLEKVAAVQDWPVPQSSFDVQSFIRFTNSYQRFIRNFSGITRPLTALTGKDIRFKWSDKF